MGLLFINDNQNGENYTEMLEAAIDHLVIREVENQRNENRTFDSC